MEQYAALRTLDMGRLRQTSLLKLHLLALCIVTTLQTGCSFDAHSDPLKWQAQTIFVQVGSVQYELAPGPIYSLAGMKDRQINEALSLGQGTPRAPLRLQDIRIGVPLEGGDGLDFEVIIVEPQGRGGPEDYPRFSGILSDIETVEFDQREAQIRGNRYEGTTTLRFDGALPIELAVSCPVLLTEEVIRNVYCSTSHLLHRGNLISLRARDGDAARVAREFQLGLELLSEIERN